MKVNYTQTKYIITNKSGFHLFIPKDPADILSRGFNSPIRLDYLEDVGYRIFYINEDLDFFEQVNERIRTHKYVYPPYLGHSNLHAKIEYCCNSEFSKLNTGFHDINSIIPMSAVETSQIKVFDGIFNILHKIPMVMETKIPLNNKYSFPNLVLTENIVFSERVNEAMPIYLNKKAESYSVEFNGGIKKIVMLPSK